MMLVDYHVHGMGHETSKHTVEELSQYLETARARGVSEVGFADHDRYLDLYNVQAIREAAASYPDVKVRLGIEMDYRRGTIPQIKEKLSRYDFDFVIGSVHEIGPWIFDHPDYQSEYKNWDLDDLYVEYYRLIRESAESGLFSFIGHCDLIKIFNYRSKSPVPVLAEEALGAIKEAGLPVEINTNGLNKPVGEMYPSEDLLKKCFDLNIPITLSSDAHFFHEVGRDLDKAREMAWRVGYRKVATFEAKRMTLVDL